jgi:N-dimethylarginine dimethylaminohydrolase
LEGKLVDAEDAEARIRKESEKYKKRYLDSQAEVRSACAQMEDYGKILERLEVDVKRLESEKDAMRRERDKALKEVGLVR